MVARHRARTRYRHPNTHKPAAALLQRRHGTAPVPCPRCDGTGECPGCVGSSEACGQCRAIRGGECPACAGSGERETRA
jgi:hypothetical protein